MQQFARENINWDNIFEMNVLSAVSRLCTSKVHISRPITFFLILTFGTIMMTAQSQPTGKQAIETLYRQMYRAMIAKDTTTLSRVHADDFVLVHMTGMRQSKQEYINAIADGTLNYFSVVDESIDISIDGNAATLTGRSRVTAAVFGGGRHTWRLQLRFTLEKRDGQWLLTSSRASTY